MNVKGLQVTLYALGIYLLLLGLVFLFAPRTAESVFQTRLPDATLTALYGQILITFFAPMALVVGRNPAAYFKLAWVFVLGQIGHVALFAFFIAAGWGTTATFGFPLVINSIFLVALVAFRGRGGVVQPPQARESVPSTKTKTGT